MPIVSDLSITSATYNRTTGALAIVGVAFGENQYAVSAVKYKKHVDAAWLDASSIGTWADSAIAAVLPANMSGGRYDVRVTNSDNETTTLDEAFKIPIAGCFFFFNEGDK